MTCSMVTNVDENVKFSKKFSENEDIKVELSHFLEQSPFFVDRVRKIINAFRKITLLFSFSGKR